MKFQATFVFTVESITTLDQALEYANEVASEEMMTTGEEVEVLQVEEAA